MSAKELLDTLNDSMRLKATFEESDIHISVTSNNPKTAKAIICVPVEGKIKIYEINAQEIGIHEGLKEP